MIYDHPWALCQDAADEDARRRLVDAALLHKGQLYKLFSHFCSYRMK
jgi:hypothetical protein